VRWNFWFESSALKLARRNAGVFCKEAVEVSQVFEIERGGDVFDLFTVP